MLTLTSALPRQQRRGDCLRGGDRSQLIRKDRTQQPRACLIGARLHRREARKALDDRVVGGLLRIGPDLAEAADRDIDDLWRDGANGLLADAEAISHAGSEVLHKYIGAGGEAQQRITTPRRLQVEDDRALVTVVVEERGG